MLFWPTSGDLFFTIAYIDPGTGSYIFQMFLALILGTVVTVKTQWKKITSYFSKDKTV